MRRPQKPFSVEVKRCRNGAASGAPVFLSRLERHAVPVVEKRPATPQPEPAKPQRRILEAIVTEPAPAPAAAEEPVNTRSSLFAESVKPRRGRPPKDAPILASAPERPKLVASNESAVYTYARREIVGVAEPAAAAYVAAPPRKKKPAVVGLAAPNGIATQNGLLGAENGNGAPAEFSAYGHVNHAERVEEATSLPRGERWKRRLPKVLW